MHIKAIKEVLARAMNKYFRFSNNIMNCCTTKLPKNKAIFKLCLLYMWLNYIIVLYHYTTITHAVPGSYNISTCSKPGHIAIS